VLPLGVIAATPRLHDGGRLAVRLGDSLLPVSHGIKPTARVEGNVVHLEWRARPAGSTSLFYRVLRAKGGGSGATCAGRLRNASDNCLLYMEDVTTVREPSFADRPGVGTWSYRIGVAANWVNDPTLGDVYVVSPPVTVTVP
jgi:hypothetical protein